MDSKFWNYGVVDGIAIPFFFSGISSQEVPEQLGYCWQNVLFRC
jgi:hypothetical protein